MYLQQVCLLVSIVHIHADTGNTVAVTKGQTEFEATCAVVRTAVVTLRLLCAVAARLFF